VNDRIGIEPEGEFEFTAPRLGTTPAAKPISNQIANPQ